jgi:hypothetical protein
MRHLAVLLLLLAYSGGAPEVDCAQVGDFTPCDLETPADGSTAMCIASTCTAVPACSGPECTDTQSFPVPDTLLHACYGPPDDGQEAEIPCPAAVGSDACATTDLCGQDAQYGWDGRHDRSERFGVADPGGEAVVTDAVTGLV